MAKGTKIELEIPQGRVMFPVEQADGLLRMKFNGGWRLPENSEWAWSAERGFEKKSKSDGGVNATAPDKGESDE